MAFRRPQNVSEAFWIVSDKYSWTILRRYQNVSEAFCVRNKLDILPLVSIASVYTLAKKIKKEVGTEFVFCVNFPAYPDPILDNGC